MNIYFNKTDISPMLPLWSFRPWMCSLIGDTFLLSRMFLMWFRFRPTVVEILWVCLALLLLIVQATGIKLGSLLNKVLRLLATMAYKWFVSKHIESYECKYGNYFFEPLKLSRIPFEMTKQRVSAWNSSNGLSREFNFFIRRKDKITK